MKAKGFLFTSLVSIFFSIINPSLALAQVVINEFVPDGNPEWIEFYNASSSADYIKSYYIDDDEDFLNDAGSSAKRNLSSLSINNPLFPYIETSSFLNNSGDRIVLFDQNGLLIDKYQFSSNPGRDISIGRYPDNNGGFSVLTYSTKADANSAPVTPNPTPMGTPQPTQTPTVTPAATPTKTPTVAPTPTKTPTLTPRATITPTSGPEGLPTAATGSVLGLGDDLKIPTSSPGPTPLTAKEKTGNLNAFLASVFVALGLALIVGSVYFAFKTSRSSSRRNDI